jgi:hypothetical protein
MGRPLLLRAKFKSDLEVKVADQLSEAGVSYAYEPRDVLFTVPARKAKYRADFWEIKNGKLGRIIIEAKGRFGHKHGNGTAVRQRLILAKEQNPDLDIRIVFQNARMKIYPKSPTTYGKWATDHGFKWSDKGIIPKEWLDEMKGTK